jgi:hypothetical protein
MQNACVWSWAPFPLAVLSLRYEDGSRDSVLIVTVRSNLVTQVTASNPTSIAYKTDRVPTVCVEPKISPVSYRLQL